MTQTALVIALVAGLLGAPLAAEAQPAGKVYRVGYLGVSQLRPETAPAFEALRAGLRDRGLIEGQNLVLEFRWAEGRIDRLPALAAELIGLPVDVLVVTSGQVTDIARAATRTTPIVFVGIGDPVAAGRVASLARPGGNLTGLTWDVGPEQEAKLLEFLKEAVPGASRVAVLWDGDPASPTARAYHAAMESAARQLKLALHQVIVRKPEEFAGVFAAIDRARADALVWCFAGLRDDPVLDFAARRRLPAVGCYREAVARGALIGYGPSFPGLMRRAAVYIDKILKGARPADLPVEQPMTFEFVINLKTAKTLGITFSQSILLRATEAIE